MWNYNDYFSVLYYFHQQLLAESQHMSLSCLFVYFYGFIFNFFFFFYPTTLSVFARLYQYPRRYDNRPHFLLIR